ncbi:MAG: hypothetical protein R2752_23700, partial [Vicinamibacterales bacterium]
MRWQRGARMAVAVVGIGTAVAIWALRREPPPPPPPVTLAPVDKTAVAEGGAGQRILFESSSTRARMTIAGWRRYENPERIVNLGVELEFVEEGLVVSADEAEFRGTETAESAPRDIDFAGHVRVKTKDGLEVTTDRATYNSTSTIVTMPGPVQFAKGRLSGSGNHGTYDRTQELLLLEDDARVELKPGPDGTGALVATGRHLTAARLEKFVRLDEQAEIVTDTDTLAADSATVYFTDDESHAKLADLQGHASVRPLPSPNGTGARPAMEADGISLGFGAGTHALERATLTGRAVATVAGGERIEAPWLDLGLADEGATVTSMDAKPEVHVTLPPSGTAPARQIDAALLAARGTAGKGLTSARFDGDGGSPVRFAEQPAAGSSAPPTTAESRVLVLALEGGLDSVRQAEFREQVRFTSGETEALADLAKYDAPRRSLELDTVTGGRGAASAPPQVTQTDLWVSARTITLGIDSHDLEARDGVSTRLKPGQEGRRGSALFDGTQDLVGASDRLSYRASDGHAEYRGSAETPARLSQRDGSAVDGETIVLDDAKGTLSAKGHVRTRFLVAETPAEGQPAAAPVPYVATGETFDYAEDTRTATWNGAPATLESTDRHIDARRIVVRLKAESKTLEHLEASTGVYATLEGDYEAKS